MSRRQAVAYLLVAIVAALALWVANGGLERSPAELRQDKLEQTQLSREFRQQKHAEQVKQEATEVEKVLKQRETERIANTIEGR